MAASGMKCCKDCDAYAPFEKIMPHFNFMIEQYQRSETNDDIEGPLDAAYWFTEMTLTSLLSAAAWQAGIPSLCEVQEARQIDRARNSSIGRADVYLSVEHGAYIEAKFIFAHWKKGQAAPPAIAQALKNARKQVGRLQSDLGHYALVFVVPYWKGVSAVTEDEADKIVEDLRPKNAEFAAWSFPTHGERLTGDNGQAFPGVITYIQQVKRGANYAN